MAQIKKTADISVDDENFYNAQKADVLKADFDLMTP